MSQEKEKQLIQRLVDATHAGKAVEKADWDALIRVCTQKFESDGSEDGYIDVYNSTWHGFGRKDEFPWSAIHSSRIDEHIWDFAINGYDDEDTISSLRNIMDQNDEYIDDYFLREIVAGDGQSAWVLVRGTYLGQAGVKQNIEDLIPTRLAVEKKLRVNGYLFRGDTPSGKTDDFTDDQIIEMVRRARKANIAMGKLREMQVGDLAVLTEREESSMASVWNVYLCLKRKSEYRYELSIRRYEALVEAAEYYDDEQEDYILPDEIDGIPVVGLEDDYVVGGELQFYNDDEAIEFATLYSYAVRAWLKENRFDFEAVVSKVDFEHGGDSFGIGRNR